LTMSMFTGLCQNQKTSSFVGMCCDVVVIVTSIHI
jgi:hypothetical protein